MKQHDLTCKMCVKHLCSPAVVTNNVKCAGFSFSTRHDSRPQSLPSVVLLSLHFPRQRSVWSLTRKVKNGDRPVLRLQAAYIRMSRYPGMKFITTLAIRVIANSILMWRFRYETKWLLGNIYQKLWVTSCSRLILVFRTVDNVFWKKY